MSSIDKPGATATVTPLNKKLRASPRKLSLIEHKRRHWFIKAEPGTGADELRHPDYWSPVCNQFTRHDLITVLTDTEDQEIELCVERVLRDGLTVSVRKVYSRESIATPGSIVDGVGNFRSEFRAGKGWCIIRAADGHPIIEGHGIEANAIAQWRREQPKSVA